MTARIEPLPVAQFAAYETIAWMMRSLDLQIDDDIPQHLERKQTSGGHE